MVHGCLIQIKMHHSIKKDDLYDLEEVQAISQNICHLKRLLYNEFRKTLVFIQKELLYR